MTKEDRALKAIRENPLAFCIAMNDQFRVGPQHVYLNELMKKVAAGGARICISLPPRHGKSFFISQYFPAWYMGNHPSNQFIGCSYASSLANEFGGVVRSLMDSTKYRQIFGDEAVPLGNSKAGSRFITKAGGRYRSVGVGGSLTGFGGHVIVVDDPIKNAETADSPRYQEMLEKFFGETLYTRLMPGGSIIVMMTRWRNNDLIGHILSKFEGWEYVNVPAIAFEDTPDPLGRAPHEALWPEMYDADALLDIKATLGDASFSALYQGRPVTEKGSSLDHSDIRFYYENDDLPVMRDVFLSVDTALSKRQSADFSAISVWGAARDYNKLYMLDACMDRLGIVDLVDKCIELSVKHSASHVVIENSAAGLPLKELLELTYEMPCTMVKPSKDKIVRFNKALPFFKRGHIHMKAAEGDSALTAMYDQLMGFPFEANDDFVDTVTQAVQHWSETDYSAWGHETVGRKLFIPTARRQSNRAHKRLIMQT